MDTKFGPYLIYFLSIDVVDSTSFKYSKEKIEALGASSWLFEFNDFFNQIDLNLIKQYNDNGNIDYLYKWRTIGDEVVYFALISEYSEILEHLIIASNTVKEYNLNKNNKLQIKATSWIAGFPVNNAILYTEKFKKIEKNNTKDIVLFEDINFIGPSIDAGFRISKYSKKEKFVISIDLALILLDLLKHDESKSKLFEIYFDNEQDTKGINSNGKYPIIWINTDCNEKQPDFLLEKNNPCCTNLLFDYCKDYMKSKSIPIPFIYNMEHDYFKPRDDYKTILENVVHTLYEEINEGNENYTETPPQESEKVDLDQMINDLFSTGGLSLDPLLNKNHSLIESQIDGDFNGFEGETIIKLTNGQIWQQNDYSYEYMYAFMPNVTIEETPLGSRMKVEGISNSVGVTRLK